MIVCKVSRERGMKFVKITKGSSTTIPDEKSKGEK